MGKGDVKDIEELSPQFMPLKRCVWRRVLVWGVSSFGKRKGP